MLEIVNYNEGEYEFPCLLVLGCFDGLHIGHAELLKKAKLQAKINGLDLGVMLFTDGKGGKQVYSFEERVALLEQYNVKFVLKVDFTDDFKKTSPLDFLQVLEDKLNVKAYMSGKDFRFGAGAKGKSSTLKNYCEDEENGVWYMSVKDVVNGTDKVSTTLIKSLLEKGDIARANELLGREYSISGVVAETIGAAVKVVYPENKVKLKEGAYSVVCTIGESEYSGEATIGETVQINLQNLDGNIDGQTIKIKFSAYCGEAQAVDTPAQPELEVAAPAVEEMAVADEMVEPADPETVEAEPELSAEDTEFEEELSEAYEEPAEETVTEEPAEETVTEVPTEEPETVEKVVPEEQPEEEADESYTLTEIAEEVEEPSEEIPEELAEEVVEELPAEETEETLEESVEEQPSEEITEDTAEEPPAEEIPEQNTEEPPVEETAEEIPEDGESGGNNE